MYQVPQGFGCVEDAIYRCTHISEFNLIFLDSLGLRSVLFLNPEVPGAALKQWCLERQIELHHSGIQPWRPAREWKAIGLATFQDALKQVLKAANHPVLIVDSSNLFVGVLRRMQHWTFSSVLAEYNAVAGTRSSYPAELFLEMIETRCCWDDQAEEPPTEPAEHKEPSASEIWKRGLQLTIKLDKNEVPAWFRHQDEAWRALNA